VKTVYLVSCVSRKGTGRQPAKELYVSDWFRKARKYVEHQGERWYILSAEHGLIFPDTVITPYDNTLNRASVYERRAWARRVLKGLKEVLAPGDCAVFIAGARYREFLVPELLRMGVEVEIPMEGMRIGEQLSWLKKQVAGG
jgi:hypothetical protein